MLRIVQPMNTNTSQCTGVMRIILVNSSIAGGTTPSNAHREGSAAPAIPGQNMAARAKPRVACSIEAENTSPLLLTECAATC